MKKLLIAVIVPAVIGLLVWGIVHTDRRSEETAREPNFVDDLFFAVLGVSLSEPPVDHGPRQELTSRWAESPPTIDGVLGRGEWERAASVKIDATDKRRPGVASGDSDTYNRGRTGGVLPYESNHAVLYVMNDTASLYVAVDVTDDVLDFSTSEGDLWRNDSVEIRVDGNLSRKRNKEHNRFGRSAIILGNGTKINDDLNVEFMDWAAQVKEDGSGYVVEARFDSEGFHDSIGFDVAINESDDSRIRQRHAQYYWNGTRDRGYLDEREWGVVHLASKEDGANSPESD